MSNSTRTGLAERFALRTSVLESGCVEWQGPFDRDGYGISSLGADLPKTAHRLAYMLAHGDIPEGATIDHLCHAPDGDCVNGAECRHRRCVNVDHLAVATKAENTYRGNGVAGLNHRKKHCIRGHAFDSANTRITPQGHRVCRACKRAQSRREDHARRAA